MRAQAALSLVALALVLAATRASAQTPTPARDVIVSTVDWAGNTVGDVQICLGNGRSGEEALFGKGTTGAQGSARFYVPGGGTSRGTVYLHATKPCPPDVEPAGQVNNIDVYACGVGGDWFHPQQVSPHLLIEIALAIGAASLDDALGAPGDCGRRCHRDLKDFFNDWYARRDPVTGECPN